MQRSGHQLLAGARFAVYEHGDVAVGEAPDSPEHLLHGGGFTDDFGVPRFLLLCRADGQLFAGVGQCTLGDGNHLVNVEGFWQVFEGALLIGRHGAVQIRMRRGDDHRQFRVTEREFFQQCETVRSRHTDIADHRVGLCVAKTLEQLLGTGKCLAVHAGLTQCSLQDPAYGLVVIDHPDYGGIMHASHPLVGK